MKKNLIFSAICFAVLLFTACEDTLTTSEFEESTIVFDTINVTGIQKAPSASIPIISAVSGSYGSSIPNSHPLYNSYLLASYSTGSQLTLSGSNFGTSQGSVLLEKGSGNSWGSTSSYSTSIVSWSNTKIVFKLYSTLTSEPIQSARFKVNLPNKSIAISKTTSIVNSTLGRLYGECTYHVIVRTLQCGLAGWTGAYSNANAVSITASYVPTKNDVLIWDGRHQAFIESVSTSKSGNITTYVLNISERNVSGTTSGGGYSTAVVNYTTTVKVNTLTKSFVSGYFSYRSTLKSGADKVRIQ